MEIDQRQRELGQEGRGGEAHSIGIGYGNEYGHLTAGQAECN